MADLEHLEKPLEMVEIRDIEGHIQQLTPSLYQEMVQERESTTKKKIISTHNESEQEITMDFRPARYIRYIGERPGAEKFESGEALFNLTGAVPIEEAQEMALKLEGHIWWSHIVSLPRADAVRAGYDNRIAWQNLVRAKAPAIAKAYNISLENLVLNCAYHNKEINPHIHLFVTSKNNRESFVLGGKKGMAKASGKLKSLFLGEIFKNDVTFLKEQKNVQEQAMDDCLLEVLRRIGHKSYSPDKALTNLFFSFAEKLQGVGGRKVYGYLPPELKEEVNQLLRCAMADSQLNRLFRDYQNTQRQFILNYVSDPVVIAEKLQAAEKRFFEPGKSDNKELHNVIVKQALLLPIEKEEKPTAIHTIYGTKQFLCSLAGLLHQSNRELQTFARQTPSEHKPRRNFEEGAENKRKIWKNYIEN